MNSSRLKTDHALARVATILVALVALTAALFRFEPDAFGVVPPEPLDGQPDEPQLSTCWTNGFFEAKRSKATSWPAEGAGRPVEALVAAAGCATPVPPRLAGSGEFGGGADAVGITVGCEGGFGCIIFIIRGNWNAATARKATPRRRAIRMCGCAHPSAAPCTSA